MVRLCLRRSKPKQRHCSSMFVLSTDSSTSCICTALKLSEHHGILKHGVEDDENWVSGLVWPLHDMSSGFQNLMCKVGLESSFSYRGSS